MERDGRGKGGGGDEEGAVPSGKRQRIEASGDVKVSQAREDGESPNGCAAIAPSRPLRRQTSSKARLSLIHSCSSGKRIAREVKDGHIRASVLAARECRLQWVEPVKQVLICKKWKDDALTDIAKDLCQWLHEEKGCSVFVIAEEDFPSHCVKLNAETVHEFAEDIDFIVCLGGDGTVLHVASLFNGPIPPVVPLAFGSLGFLTHFDHREAKAAISKVLRGHEQQVDLTVRMRICVSIYRKGETKPEVTRLALNELLLERGPSPYMATLEAYVNGTKLTTVQADGILIATPTGSTAYSLSAGGSITTPTVPALLFTPICPHSLSFRPVIFPDSSTIKIAVPEDARATAWATMDGRNSTELKTGDWVVVRMSEFPLSVVNRVSTSADWVRAITHKLYWNKRERQGAGGVGTGAGKSRSETETEENLEESWEMEKREAEAEEKSGAEGEGGEGRGDKAGFSAEVGGDSSSDSVVLSARSELL